MSWLDNTVISSKSSKMFLSLFMIPLAPLIQIAVRTWLLFFVWFSIYDFAIVLIYDVILYAGMVILGWLVDCGNWLFSLTSSQPL